MKINRIHIFIFLLLVTVLFCGIPIVEAQDSEPIQFFSTTGSEVKTAFDGGIFSCDTEKMTPDSFRIDESFCLEGTWHDDPANNPKNLIIEWEDGVGETQAFLSRDVRNGDGIRWSFAYTDPGSAAPNTGKVTVKDYDTCQEFAVYPVRMARSDDQLSFIGSTSVCDAKYNATDRETTFFGLNEAVCLTGTLTGGIPDELYPLEFVWEDGQGTITRVPVDSTEVGETLTIYYYYDQPSVAAPNEGFITVYNTASNEVLNKFPVYFYDPDKDLNTTDPFELDAATYLCDESGLPTGSPVSQFNLDQTICVTAVPSGVTADKPRSIMVHWQDGIDNDVIILNKHLFTNQVEFTWSFYYLDPSYAEPNHGTISIRDYDTCTTLGTMPVEFTLGEVTVEPTLEPRIIDAGIDF